MADPTHDELEARLRAHFAEHDRVPPLAVDSAKALYGLRRIDEELIELTEASVPMRGDDGDTVARFERDDVVLVVRRRANDALVMVSPASTPVSIETAEGSVALETDDDGVATVPAVGPVRFRIELPDGTSGVTDGIDLSPSGGDAH
ncbi:hypothetical protein [Salsipaludibacter albus]|uniref:hypothetical protein n=1 Tax=Salsipaludibacter albus TaxID=2849650 RepID=UPI001EE4948C|nr:hypothetical protein [Salsipaludibacter albus]MBY5163466.1 hypothetical protein [Salsipaludibacter albus]